MCVHVTCGVVHIPACEVTHDAAGLGQPITSVSQCFCSESSCGASEDKKI